ncbi:hypothetical protein M569_06417, partial [Genlisea aurea]
MKTATHVTGFLNFLAFLLSIPVLGGAIWLSSRAATTDCFKFLQWPLVVVGASLILVSLAGFAGTCYRNTFLMYVYLWAMFFIIAALVGVTVFAFSVTGKGSGHPVLNRVYLEYDLRDFSGWLAGKVAGRRNWEEISSCVRDSDVCRQMAIAGDTAEMFYLRKLTPIQSGCCKPPTSCGYTYINETYWVASGGLTGADRDCATWSDDQEELCFNCDSCKAGVLATAASSWRKVSVINVVILVVLVLLYVVAYKAFRHNKKLDNDEAYGETRMEKAQP